MSKLENMQAMFLAKIIVNMEDLSTKVPLQAIYLKNIGNIFW